MTRVELLAMASTHALLHVTVRIRYLKSLESVNSSEFLRNPSLTGVSDPRLTLHYFLIKILLINQFTRNCRHMISFSF